MTHEHEHRGAGDHSRSSSPRFAGQVAIVTGSSWHGIGRAVAERIAREGGSVIINGRDAGRLAETQTELRDRGLQVTGVAGDITVEGTADALTQRAVDEYGGVDLLVSNVGLGGKPSRAHQTEREPFSHAVVGSAWATLDLVRAAMERGLANGHGSVVSISSAIVRQLIGPTTAYAASKIALESVTRSLAIDLGPEGVRVNAVAPGQTRSEAARPMWEKNEAALSAKLPLRRLAEPDEIASAVCFLLSDDASYITGQVIDVDAGMTVAGAVPDLRTH